MDRDTGEDPNTVRKGSVLARVTAASVLCLTLLASLLVPASPAVGSSGRLAQTRREIAATRARLAGALHDDRAILAALNEITAHLNHEQSLLYAAQSRLRGIDLAIRAEERRLKELDAAAATRKAVIAARVRTLYILGPVDDLEAVTGGTNVEEFIGRAGALESIARFDRSALEEIASISYEVTLTRRALAMQRAQAAEVRNEVADRVEIVAEYASVKQEAHRHAAGRVSALRDELAALQREQARIVGIIHSRGSVYTGGTGRLGFAWPIRGRITSPYGPRWGSFHTGIDIDCRTGDPIGASKAGKVIESGWGGGYGNMVIIDHGGGYATLYAHQSRIYVRSGQRVSQHQTVGACGATGNATGDHLHFEVRVNGQHVNPRNYLP